jgi:hypothetical protein
MLKTLQVLCCRCLRIFLGTEAQLKRLGWLYEGDEWYCPDCAIDWEKEQEGGSE